MLTQVYRVLMHMYFTQVHRALMHMYVTQVYRVLIHMYRHPYVQASFADVQLIHMYTHLLHMFCTCIFCGL